jgi:hypothetical protein
LSRWKLIKAPLIVTMTIVNPCKSITSTCKYE